MSILYSCQHDEDRQIENQLRQALPDETFYRWPDCADKSVIEMAIVWQPPEDFFQDLSQLKLVFSLAAGVDHILKHPKLPEGIPVVRLEDAGMGEKMAEYVLYGVLQAQRRFNFYAQAQQRQVWAHDAGTVHAKDFRVGILGLGVLGSVVAKRLLLNGYAVSGWSRRAKSIDGVEAYTGEQGLAEMLPQLDVLVCLLPLTDSTRQILNAAVFQQCKPGFYLINLARGEHLQTEDLLAALESGQASGALLDVTDPEPLSAGHALWTQPGVTVTPHIAGPTQEAESVQQIVDNISRYRRAEALQGLIDRQQGY